MKLHIFYNIFFLVDIKDFYFSLLIENMDHSDNNSNINNCPKFIYKEEYFDYLLSFYENSSCTFVLYDKIIYKTYLNQILTLN